MQNEDRKETDLRDLLVRRGKLLDKWESYLNFYEELAFKYSQADVRILEIGVQNGGSLELWADLFPQAAIIVGCDVDNRCASLSFSDSRIELVIGDASAPEVAKKILNKSANFDIIIDDGSHKSSDIIKTFALYFPFVSPGGIYIAEDLHCSYMKAYEGGMEAPFSAVSFFKRLLDIVNHGHWGAAIEPSDALEFFKQCWGVSFDNKSLAEITELQFRDSLCAIRRRPHGGVFGLGRRVVSGEIGQVNPGIAELRNEFMIATDETGNEFGPLSERAEATVWRRKESANLYRQALEQQHSMARQIKELELALHESEALARCASQRLQEIETQMRDERLIGNEVQAALEAQLLQLRGDIQLSSESRAALSESLNEAKVLLAESVNQAKLQLAAAAQRAEFRVGEKQAEINKLKVQLDQAIGGIDRLQRIVLKSRLRPHRLLRDWAAFHVLKLASRSMARVSERHASRWARSAQKRDPQRRDVLPNGLQANGAPPASARLIPVAANNQELLTKTRQELAAVHKSGTKDGRLKFSILVPVFNTRAALLRECVTSVLHQSYRNWDLKMVNDGSTQLDTIDALTELSHVDPRIEIIHMSKNSGISAASQRALEACDGEFVVLLDHDDVLFPDALAILFDEIERFPLAGMIYTDECKLDVNGNPVEIFFKPDWSPSLLLNCMYVGHLTCYRRDVVVAAGGFRSQYDFSQDYDLALRVSEMPIDIRHIRSVLYGWRAIPESAAGGGKVYARSSNVAALGAAALRRGWRASARAGLYANLLDWDPPSCLEKVSIIIPSDNAEMIRASINSIVNQSQYSNYELLIVTNSQIISQLEQEGHAARFVPFDKKFNFSEKCNVGAKAARGGVLIFYNDDVRVLTPNWIEKLLDCFRMEGVGLVGPKLLYENSTIQHAGMVTGVRGLVGTAFHCLEEMTPTYFNFAQSLRDVSVLCGALLAVRTSLFDQIGGFDSDNTPIYHSDVDLCFRVRAQKMRCVYTPHVSLLHVGHASLGKEEKERKNLSKEKATSYLLKRWVAEVADDPYFPPGMRRLCYHDSPDPFEIHPGERQLATSNGNVLLVSHDLSASGAPRVLLEVSKLLRKEGWFVVVTSPVDGPIRDEFTKEGITVIVDSLLFRSHDTVAMFAKDFDVIIVNTVVGWPFVRQIKALGCVPLVWYIHEIDLVNHLASNQPEVVGALGVADMVLAGSELCGDNLRRYGVNVCVLPYGIESRAERRTKDAHAVIRVGVFGSFERRKGQDLIAAAFSSLEVEERSGISIHLFGRTLDEGLREAVFREFGSLEGLFFEGELTHAEYIAELNNCDLVVVPSRCDTLPLVSLDALGAGIPLLCTRETGTSSYIVDSQSGFIADSATVGDIALALRRALACRGKWPAIGDAGRLVFAERFSVEAFRDKLSSICQKLAAPPRQGTGPGRT